MSGLTSACRAANILAMVTASTLDSYLGKHIRDICGNAYADDSDNHCAHFVSHVLGLRFGATCHMLGKGKAPGANVRVQELFGRCLRVGTWDSLTSSIPMCLVFITNPGNVKVASRTMYNVPRKHMGIHMSVYIWHYSNTLRKVVKQSPEEFSRHYPAPDNAMFYGTIA
jgi:hypothetical protein